MYLKFYIGKDGKRVYTLQDEAPNGQRTLTAHPARFSPEDSYSKERIQLKKRFNLI